MAQHFLVVPSISAKYTSQKPHRARIGLNLKNLSGSMTLKDRILTAASATLRAKTSLSHNALHNFRSP